MAEAIGAAGPVSGRRLLGVVAGLGLTQVIGYGTLYYSFSILAAGMAADIGWSQDAVYGAFSAALLVGALIGPRCGRWVDRHGAGRIMALGSIAAAAALVACAIAPGRSAWPWGWLRSSWPRPSSCTRWRSRRWSRWPASAPSAASPI
ncbi:MFS transporter [Inquilinus limosus]|uniref:hypothetical protein n=1 Tax=Inquilinus limosus TaxID=171674 RepID=UPI001269FBF5|nr:hypothetical protein [Inquilinus limosus]